MSDDLRSCRGCGTMIQAPATVCSDACYGEAYGETRQELYEDSRHAAGIEDEETEEEEE